ncbi:MAG: sensor histidine kinase, partial [Solirubrobacteraceae bacterium]
DNLIANALGHGAGPIDVRAAEAPGGRIALSVSDAGPGIPAPLLEHVFERFTQGDPAHSGAGSGLGLAIVDALARAHGGSVRATNGPAGGAVVVVELPAA